jgi:hypothetical protein
VSPNSVQGIRFSQVPEVNSLSPDEEFVIALHSPSGFVETGLPVCLPEKKATELTGGVQRDTFSSPV